MNEVAAALSAAAVLAVGLCWLVWWLVRDARSRRRRTRAARRFALRYQVEPGLLGRRRERPRHLHRGEHVSGGVAQAVEQVVQNGDGTRLISPEDDVDAAGWVRPYAQDQCPTAVFPVLSEETLRGCQAEWTEN